MSKGSKGQVFTLDMIAVILAITLMLGIVIQYQDMIRKTGPDTIYREMKTISRDIAHFRVKRKCIAEESASKSTKIITYMYSPLPNRDKCEFTNLPTALTGMRYNYTTGGEAGCEDEDKVAVTKRLLVNEEDKEVKALEVKVCPR